VSGTDGAGLAEHAAEPAKDLYTSRWAAQWAWHGPSRRSGPGAVTGSNVFPDRRIEGKMVAVMARGGTPTQADFHAAIAARGDRWYAACLRITHSPELADDAVQEALLTAWRKRRQFKGDAKLETWIHSIAVNAALQLLRKQRPGAFTTLNAEPPDAAAGPSMDCHQLDVGERLARVMELLTGIERVCFVLKHLEQWRAREIAEELGTTESNAKQAVFRAVKKLRVALADMRSEET